MQQNNGKRNQKSTIGSKTTTYFRSESLLLHFLQNQQLKGSGKKGTLFILDYLYFFKAGE